MVAGRAVQNEASSRGRGHLTVFELYHAVQALPAVPEPVSAEDPSMTAALDRLLAIEIKTTLFQNVSQRYLKNAIVITANRRVGDTTRGHDEPT